MSTAAAPPRSTDRRSTEISSETRSRWPLERVLFLMAGTMTALSVVLAVLVSPLFLLLTLFVAVNQLAFVVFGNCPSSWLMRRYLGLRGAGEQPR
jgi:hypothetical protein